MLENITYQRKIPYSTVLMDSWYATKELMVYINNLQKIFYCPLKVNRLVDDSGTKRPYQRVDSLTWDDTELKNGKRVKINGFPKESKVKLFRVTANTRRTDWIVTNDQAQNDTQVTQEVCHLRWKIEQFHRELKQLTGIESNQCRKQRIQRNHIACAMLVWCRFTAIAEETGKTVYQLKRELLDGYLIEQLKNPSLKMVLA